MSQIDEREPDRYPALRDDLRTADRILEEPFSRADAAALAYQKKYRRAELAIIWGGVLAVALGVGAGLAGTAGAAEAAEGSALGAALAFVEVAVAAGLGSLAFIARGLKWQGKYLRRRWAAETLRGERFLFLARSGPYAGASEPERVLRQRIVDIERLVRGRGEPNE